mmetsp:Transcript_45169/g.80774  ORF Transcript_45169/g.80774 Transcript_45169/m.80774 type:complete len:279 (-) Transcript_45169:57-893(-)
MKFNIASPLCGTQKLFEVDEEKRLVQLNDLRISQEFNGEILGDQFKGYVFKITGGHDKQGFPMKQGVLANSRVKLLINRGECGLQKWRVKPGARKRRSIRGCIVGHDISVLNLIITQEGEEKLEGLTDHTVPRRLGPKRASKIRKLFNLGRDDDVRKFVIRRQLPEKGDKKARSKAPKIQRLVTPITLERKRRKLALMRTRRAKSREERDAYQHLLDRRRILRGQHKKASATRKQLGARNKELAAIAQEAAKAKAAAAAAAAAAKAKPAAKKAAPKKK